MSDVQFRLARSGGREILTENNTLKNVAWEAIKTQLPVIEAQFFQQFGFEGRFVVSDFITDRYSAKIAAADVRTAAILKKNPKWLDQFTQNIKL